MSTFGHYYALTKPGIIRGNALTATAGFFLAARGHIDLMVFIAMLGGLSLIIASGCICNNYIDREIDSKMTRTRARGLVSGVIPVRNALILAAVLGVGGTAILVAYTNLLAAALGVFGFFAYVVVYGVAKRRSVHGTVIGSISGAIPPLVGYSAVSGRLDLAAVVLFLILVAWQMPHFYAIAIYRLDDYAAAGIPVLPVRRGMRHTKLQMIAYSIVFAIVATSLFAFGYAGYMYLVAMLLLSISWLRIASTGMKTNSHEADIRWARKMFGFSLLVISGLCLSIVIDSFLRTR